MLDQTKEPPSDWTVSRFEFKQGLCFLKRPGSDEVAFGMSYWAPYPNMDHADPDARWENDKAGSPFWPRVGEPVRVTWALKSGSYQPVAVTPTARRKPS